MFRVVFSFCTFVTLEDFLSCLLNSRTPDGFVMASFKNDFLGNQFSSQDSVPTRRSYLLDNCSASCSINVTSGGIHGIQPPLNESRLTDLTGSFLEQATTGSTGDVWG